MYALTWALTELELQVTEDSIKRLLFSEAFLGSFHRLAKNHGVAFPLNFPSVLSEINFIAILSLLNFASGYRAALHKQTGKGAYDNIRTLMFSLFLSSTDETSTGNLLSARGLQIITAANVAEFMQVNVHVEKPHPSIPGVILGELGGPLHELVTLIARALNETGDVLVRGGYRDLGTFVLQCFKEAETNGRDKGRPLDLDEVLEKVRSIHHVHSHPLNRTGCARTPAFPRYVYPRFPS